MYRSDRAEENLPVSASRSVYKHTPHTRVKAVLVVAGSRSRGSSNEEACEVLHEADTTVWVLAERVARSSVCECGLVPLCCDGIIFYNRSPKKSVYNS